MAAFLTLGITIALTVYAFTTKKDFTIFGSFFFFLIFGIFSFSILNFFIQSTGIVNLVLIASTIIYGIYLIYDT